ncbi:molecular chaperone DnaJ [Mycobacterium sp. SMC-4]|uniref:molecular chaperone DnaJ n=1 Tax=Mycobacterium sp. SMC-4 TaxID=2857059 RepID=UPI0021B1E6B0|nr:molecular chaperone DnaJ [Mycobacterium sp. SMC-4]UXA19507.1 molecular chaperone DnaJ [Mycobacterium sp. SMC-4]
MNYPPGMTLRPLDGWPTEFTRSRRDAPFRSTFTSTIELLDRELRQLDPKDRHYPPSVLQLALRERDFRIDGMPRANSYPEHPGVILNIEPRNKPAMSFPCDTFTDWRDNLRAIALTLEALRKMDRYGTTNTGQQYRGWQALPEKSSVRAFTVDDAEQFLRSLAGEEGAGLDIGTVQQAYRRAARVTHPDHNGGDRTRWNLVEAAAGVLRAAGKLA